MALADDGVIPTVKQAEAEATRLYAEIVKVMMDLYPFTTDPTSEGFNAFGELITEYGSARFWAGCGHVR